MPLTDAELEKIDPVENLKDRPESEEYFLAIAKVVSQRSMDPSSKCGAIIVSKEGRTLSTGYNGPLRGSIDEEIPLIRPDRYFHMVHAEENAIIAYNGSYEEIHGATIYVTGRPCHRCLRMIIQKGILRVLYGDNKTFVVDSADLAAQEIMLRHHPEVELRYVDKGSLVKGLLESTARTI